MKHCVYDDGGRHAAGYRGQTGDCVTRAIAIATQRPYEEIYKLVNYVAQDERTPKWATHRSSARRGIHRRTTHEIIENVIGWTWTPTMKIGSGCRVHLRADELPKGRLIVQVTKHVTAVIDGVIHDTHDPSRGGTRCVYGYWRKD